jgi:hypothetical protein
MKGKRKRDGATGYGRENRDKESEEYGSSKELLYQAYISKCMSRVVYFS